MLSQTDIIRHIVHHPDCISNLIDMNATIQDLGFVDDSKQLTTVQGHQQTALYTYRLMAEKKLSGIPILDEQGQFLGDLCLEDLPGANLDMVDLLDLPCVDYLKVRNVVFEYGYTCFTWPKTIYYYETNRNCPIITHPQLKEGCY